MMAENDAVEAEKTEAEMDGNASPINDELEAETEEMIFVEAVDDSNNFQPEGEPEQSNKRKKWQPSPALRQVISWFAACGRCSFFLAGYGLIGDEDVLETAVSSRGKKWLTVPWSHDLAQLVYKTYGSRIDVTYYHFEGQCKECQRRFTYQGSEEDQPPTFRIELKP
jgi:hypothetical protein